MINQKEKMKLITIKYYHDYVSVPISHNIIYKYYKN